MFREQKISILEWFLKEDETLRIGVMMLKMQLCIKLINYIWKYIQIENKIFKIVISQYLLYFLANKCSFGEHKRLIKNILKKKWYQPQMFAW